MSQGFINLVVMTIAVVIALYLFARNQKKKTLQPQKAGANQPVNQTESLGTASATPISPSPVAPTTPVAPVVTLTLKEKVKKFFTTKEFLTGIGIGVGLVTLVGIMLFVVSDEVGTKNFFPYILALIVGCLVYFNTKKEKRFDSTLWATAGTVLLIVLWMYHGQLGALLVGSSKVVGQISPQLEKGLLVYIIAPVMGLMSYFLSNRGSKRFFYSLMITAATAVVIALWIHPEVLKTVVSLFGASSNTKHAWGLGGLDFSECLAVVLLILAVLSGKLIDAIVGVLLMLILWNCF